MTLSFHTLWLVCALAAVVFTTVVAASRRGLMVLALAFAASSAWSFRAAPLPPEAIGLLTAGAAVGRLTGPARVTLPALAGGVLGGSWSALLTIEGVPAWSALPAALALVALTVTLTTRRPAFAPARLQEDGLAFIAALGVCAAALPGVSEGWRAATTLNLEGPAPATEAVPAWAIAVGASSVALGALSSLWSRR